MTGREPTEDDAEAFQQQVEAFAEALDRAQIPFTVDWAYIMLALSVQTLILYGISRTEWVEMAQTAWSDGVLCAAGPFSLLATIPPTPKHEVIVERMLILVAVVMDAGITQDSDGALTMMVHGVGVMRDCGIPRTAFGSLLIELHRAAEARLHDAARRGGGGASS